MSCNRELEDVVREAVDNLMTTTRHENIQKMANVIQACFMLKVEYLQALEGCGG